MTIRKYIDIIHRNDDPTTWTVREYQKRFGVKYRVKEYRFIDGLQAAQFAEHLKQQELIVE